jgi:hypothetical protein
VNYVFRSKLQSGWYFGEAQASENVWAVN